MWPICSIFCVSQILVKVLKESLVSARTPLVATAAWNTASVLPSKCVFVQKNEDLFLRMPLLCFVRGRGNLFGNLATFLLYYPSKFFLPCVSINTVWAVIFPFSHYTGFICAESLEIWMHFDWMWRGSLCCTDRVFKVVFWERVFHKYSAIS